ncbi:MAG: response regulator transcription factor [Janthinobacterium lividum]
MNTSAASAIVYIVDDDEDMRTSLSWLLASVKIETRSFGSVASFFDALDLSMPSCLVVDVRMPETGGFELQAELNRRGVSIPTIFVSGHGDIPMSVRALQNGAIDFVEKPYNSQEMLERIQRALKIAAETHILAQQREVLLHRIRALTPREQQVFTGVLEGKPSKQIARDLAISAKTVDVHRASIKEKLRATSIASLVKDVLTIQSVVGGPGLPF